jgi:hypothetical protein
MVPKKSAIDPTKRLFSSKHQSCDVKLSIDRIDVHQPWLKRFPLVIRSKGFLNNSDVVFELQRGAKEQTSYRLKRSVFLWLVTNTPR